MNQNEGQSLKDILKIIGDYISFFVSNFLFIISVLVIFVGIFISIAMKSDTTYRAERTFVVNAGDNSSTIELPIGGGGFGFGGKMYKISSLEKILMLSKSENIIFSTLLSKMSDSDDLICNQIIKSYELDKKPIIVTKDFEQLSIDDKKTLRYIKSNIIPDIVNTSYEDESQVFRILSKSNNEELSYSLTNTIFERLVAFYVGNSTEKARYGVNTLEARKDSIEKVLLKGEFELAKMRDQGSNYILSTSAVDRYRKKREVEFNTKLYLEVDNLLEIARYKLEGVTPILTTIDQPFFPLRKKTPSVLNSGLLGLLIGFLISILLLVLRKIYINAMSSQ